MLMPSIFRTNVFDDFFEDPFKDFTRMNAPSRPTHELMRTDVKEMENGFEVSVSLPGVKKEDITAELKDGYLTITASTGTSKDEKDEDGDSSAAPREPSTSAKMSQRKTSRLSMRTVS